ncbi:MAG: NUDIX domain-containing protein [Candidatus Micrarchaeota archaeon]|nr:NUDIX domain-containing protein [Candidatus Micrarchaeota archaeon]MDE1833997.1 NUDIX domain-containing protein [Candidatus Micrarchaeota archaeon]MDE1859503.1 NUDIX domain-containing protein [Candidatus Micrarchaeota archaeon]
MDKIQTHPEVAVGTFILNKNGELLLVESYKWPGVYSCPGGKIELGESIAQTAVREAKEETGLDIKFRQVINMQEAVYPKGFIVKRHFIFIDALCTTKSMNVKLEKRELQNYVWVRPKAALKLKLNTYTRKAINDILKRKKL